MTRAGRIARLTVGVRDDGWKIRVKWEKTPAGNGLRGPVSEDAFALLLAAEGLPVERGYHTYRLDRLAAALGLAGRLLLVTAYVSRHLLYEWPGWGSGGKLPPGWRKYPPKIIDLAPLLPSGDLDWRPREMLPEDYHTV